MIKKNYTGAARRARNIIWNAAGRYDFDPPFMAFFANGHPDQYFNMVAGLVQKWLDMPRLWNFFLSYEGDRRADEFDDLLKLGFGLEQAHHPLAVFEEGRAEILIVPRLERILIKRVARQPVDGGEVAGVSQRGVKAPEDFNDPHGRL